MSHKWLYFWICTCNVNSAPTDVSLTKFSGVLHTLDKVSLGYCVPNQTVPEWGMTDITRLQNFALFWDTNLEVMTIADEFEVSFLYK
jgi:hypothetical protein